MTSGQLLLSGKEAVLDYALLAYDIYAGFDVGKFSHHLVAVRAKDQHIIASRRIAQDENEIRDALEGLMSMGKVLVAVDQKGSIGRLLVATAKSMDVDIGFITPSDFHAFAKGYTEVKSDARDAHIIADVAMRFTTRLHPVADFDEAIEVLRVQTTLRAALVQDSTQDKNRIRSLLVQVHPAFEAYLGKGALNVQAYLRILEHYGGPGGIKRAGRKNLEAFISKQPYCKNKAKNIAEGIFSALFAQTVRLHGSDAREDVVRYLAATLILRKQEIECVEKRTTAAYRCFSESIILSSMPGVGDVFGAVMLAEIGDINQYRDAGHLAAYAGVAPSKRQSGTTLDGAKKKIKCNRQLRNAFCESARISINSDEWSRWLYDKKRAEGKKHRQAILALARHRTDILYAMLKNGSLYEPKTIRR